VTTPALAWGALGATVDQQQAPAQVHERRGDTSEYVDIDGLGNADRYEGRPEHPRNRP
jgi:hypothetical protein